ncbi:ornithine cyclodeaminase family protein [Actinobacteria bacterium YIM 96077]|uniref:Ornithine cyclodeaminase family protein n=1 Tax=Phytoactinopolyspora halophila TaxID=1981511 RepID=A0A329QW12_9ACTN|nr:NAD(P)-binding domain-containing protein [Phytoactinopolyspora halophila]AYY12759.1 ornithine cyclodeaminase family protein [Actinobacteria bacterium YIM 96077]RAW16447.1 ornithine cyclodeaminase family protein [Phytoactinopolyspora halophila]
MSRILLLDHAATGAALDTDRLLGALRTALIATSRGDTSTPPRVAAYAPAGILGAMPGYVPGLGLAGKFVSIFSGLGPGGRSAHQGLVALFDENDGHLLAIMNGEAITARRTTGSATVAFQALAPPQVERIAVVGAGTQARAQLALLQHLEADAEIVVSRTPASAAEVADEYGVQASTSVEEAVSGADVVFCCTHAGQPVVRHAWLRPHAHVSSVGGSLGPELEHATVTGGSLFVEWPGASTCAPPAGAHELQDVPDGHARLVGEVLARDVLARDVLAGDVPARTADELTVFKSTGYAALDVAAAAATYEAATAAGLGTEVTI